MEPESKKVEIETDSTPEASANPDNSSLQSINDRKDEDEEEEEEDEDKIVEKSPNSRFHKRNKRYPKQIEGVDNAFVAIEPKSGKEVIWNECLLSEKKGDKENRYLSLIKKLKRSSHPFLVRFLDAWVTKSDDGPRKLVFITERLDDCTLKQFLCNSAKNNRLWKRHVGQLLSVLMFLHRLGTTHGNLTKEAVYYQNSGNLKVGPFALGGSMDQKSKAADIFSLGVLALEIAVWTPSDFPLSTNINERCQQMLSKLEDDDKKSFIEACFDTNPASKVGINRLVNHPSVTEVPVLKLLSARVIVNSISNEEGGSNEPTGFSSLLKDYMSHYEDETVIMEVHFKTENLTKTRLWKEFRSNFTLTSKFLEDANTKKQKYERIYEKKLATSPEALCKGFPAEFEKYLLYARGLEFESNPDYVFLRGIFRRLFQTLNFLFDFVYDWALLGTNSSNANQAITSGGDAEDSNQQKPQAECHGIEAAAGTASRVVSNTQAYGNSNTNNNNTNNHGHHHNLSVQPQQQMVHVHQAADGVPSSNFHSQYIGQSVNSAQPNTYNGAGTSVPIGYNMRCLASEYRR